MKLLLVSALTLVTSMQAMAQRHHDRDFGRDLGRDYGRHGGMREAITLHLNEQTIGPQTIFLKRELQYQHPNIAIQDLELLAVNVMAKSRHGRGEVVLRVGQDYSYPQLVAGNPMQFDRPGPHTFDQIRIQNPSFGDQGVWQLELKGNIKIKKVDLIVKTSARVRTQDIVLYTNEQQTMGQAILPLKMMIKRQNPMIDLQNADLKKVVLIAKSRHGMGQASLLVGYNTGYPQTIPGNPRMFDHPGPRTFTPVTLMAPAFSSDQGKWQVELRGNVKIQQVIVTIQTNNGGYGPGPIGPGPVRPPRRF